MRIGTWNLAGRWSPQHERFLLEKDCDVWLLTEVSERVALPGFSAHLGTDSLDALLARLPTGGRVWGGDWNHALSGREYAGSHGGRAALLCAVETLALQGPTADLPHQLEGLLSIDHIAVPVHADVKATEHWTASIDSARPSDHDAYVVEVGSLR